MRTAKCVLPKFGASNICNPENHSTKTFCTRVWLARLRWFSSRIFLRRRRFFGVASTYSSDADVFEGAFEATS